MRGGPTSLTVLGDVYVLHFGGQGGKLFYENGVQEGHYAEVGVLVLSDVFFCVGKEVETCDCEVWILLKFVRNEVVAGEEGGGVVSDLLEEERNGIIFHGLLL